jgi:hypothetical protein
MSDSYWAIFSRGVSGASVVVRRRRFNPDKASEGVSFRGRSHPIDLSHPIYREKKRYYYLIDVDGGQRTVQDIGSTVSPKLMDAVMKREIAKQLVAGLQGVGDWKLALIIGLICLGAGIMGGIVLGQFIDFTPTVGGNGTIPAFLGVL